MAAVIDLSTARRLAVQQRPVRGTAAPIGRSGQATAPAVLPTPQRQTPELRVLEGGRSEAALRLRRTYLRRRLVVAAALLLVVVGAVRLAGAAVGALSSAPAPAVAERLYQVESGDTLWAVAGRFLPNVDRRDAVDMLLEANPSAVDARGGLRTGDVLRVPSR